MSISAHAGIIETQSNHTVEFTVEKLKKFLETNGIKLFAVIDHSGEAATIGLKMPETKLLIFGNPKAGTPVMLASPSSAIDLPLKILVRADEDGKVWVSHNAPGYLRDRHGIPQELIPNLSVLEKLVTKIAA